MIWDALYDLIKLLMLSSQSREFHKFFCAGKFFNCCSYTTFRRISRKVSLLNFAQFAKIIFAKKFEISRKSLRNTIENFRIFSHFGNPTVLFGNFFILLKNIWNTCQFKEFFFSSIFDKQKGRLTTCNQERLNSMVDLLLLYQLQTSNLTQ